jgi:hypothetical protein
LKALEGQRVDVDVDRTPENPHEARLLAERAFQAGLADLNATHYAKAAPQLARASKLLPESEEYRLYAKWAAARARGNLAFHPVERGELKKIAVAALKIDPNFAFGLYVAGSLALEEDDAPRAHRFLAHAAKLDPQLLDAKRQLRIVERRLAESKKR